MIEGSVPCFECSVCGTRHELSPIPAVTLFRAKSRMGLMRKPLREKWLKAMENHKPTLGDEMGTGVVKASLAYFRIFPPHTAPLPSTVTTVETRDGFKVRCVECPKP